MTDEEADEAGLHLPAPPLAVPVSPLDFSVAVTTSTAAPTPAVTTSTSTEHSITSDQAAQESDDE